MKHVYPLYRKNKNRKSKIDIDFQFLILNWKLNGRMTHGPFCCSFFHNLSHLGAPGERYKFIRSNLNLESCSHLLMMLLEWMTFK